MEAGSGEEVTGYISLLIRGKGGLKLYKNWIGVEVNDTLTFSELLQELRKPDNSITNTQINIPVQNETTNVSERVFCSLCRPSNINSPQPDCIEVMKNLKILKAVKQFGRNVIVEVDVQVMTQSDSDTESDSCLNTATAKKSAFDILMSGASKMSVNKTYPDILGGDNPSGDHCIYNALIQQMKTSDAYLTGDISLNASKKYLRSLKNVLFYISPHLDKLAHENIYIPDMFLNIVLSDKNDLKSYRYNRPSEHKHACQQLSREKLLTLNNTLYETLGFPFLHLQRFQQFKDNTKVLADCIDRYLSYLLKANNRMMKSHALESLSTTHSGSITQLPANYMRNPLLIKKYRAIEEVLIDTEFYSEILLDPFLPQERRQRFEFKDNLRGGLPFPAEMFTVFDGCSTLTFIWRVPPEMSKRNLNKTRELCGHIENTYSKVYHSRAMRKKFQSRYSLLLKQHGVGVGVLPSILREIYSDLTEDASLPSNAISKNVQLRLQILLDSEDPDMVFDLRHFNKGQPRQYDEFFDAVSSYINEHSLNVVHDRRHDDVGRMGLAISVRDLIAQVRKRLSDDVLVPSESYLRLQFWPKNPTFMSALHYTGRLAIKFMVQSRQIRHEHVDSHYAAAVYKYLRQFCIKFSDNCTLSFLDDKHNVKIGEPGVPVASAERGRQVLVSTHDTSFSAGDHDFTKFKIVPSATLVCDVPDSIEGSFYAGKLHVCIKDQVFQPSSPIRHMAEFSNLLTSSGVSSPIIAIYSDGGPDHRITYLTVQLSLLAFFLDRDLDMLIAARTAPYQSFRNPIERCMATFNLGLQFVSLMRAEMSEENEKAIKKANSMAKIREVTSKNINLKDATMDSMKKPIELLGEIFGRLNYSDNAVKVEQAADRPVIDNLWSILSQIDPSFNMTGNIQKKELKNFPTLKAFLDLHMTQRQYFVCFNKCKPENACDYCQLHPPRLPMNVFSDLHPLPDPVPSHDGQHYKPFDILYGTITSEDYRPSLNTKGAKRRAQFDKKQQSGQVMKKIFY